MWSILESRSALKQLSRCPKRIAEEYEAWKKVVELTGPAAIRLIPGYMDHALDGSGKGDRSSSLNGQWGVTYAVSDDLFRIKVLEVAPHGRRKKD